MERDPKAAHSSTEAAPSNHRVALSDDEISTTRVSRRSLLGALGIGAGLAAAAAFGASTPAQAADARGRGRRCRYRDRDPGDGTRRSCGVSDND